MANDREGTNPFSTDLPQFAHLAQLEDRARELQQNGAKDAEGRAETIAGWQALQDAARLTILPDGSEHPLAHITKIKIAALLYANGDIEAATAMAQDGIGSTQPFLDAYPVAMADGAALLGILLNQKGDPERALAIMEPTYAQFLGLEDGVKPSGFYLAKSNLEHSLSQVNLRMGRTRAAMDHQKASLDTREGNLGPNHPDTVSAYYNYAQTLRRAGRGEEAEKIARIAVERASAHVDPSHPSYARSFEMLGIVLANAGRPVEASEFLSTALALKRQYEGADTLIFGYGIHNLGSILLQRHKYAEAQALFAEAEEIMSHYQGPASSFPILALAYNGQAALALGDPAQASRLLDEGRQRLGKDTSDVEVLARIMPDLTRALLLDGKQNEAMERATAFEQQVLASDTTDAFEIAFARILRLHAAQAGRGVVAEAGETVLGTIERSVGANQFAGLEVRHLAAIDLVMEIAAQHNDAALMLGAMSLVSGSHIKRASRYRAEQLLSENTALAELLRDLGDAQNRLETADRALLLAIARGEARENFHTDREQARATITGIEQLLREQYPEWVGASLHSAPSIAALQSSLGEGEAVLAISPVYYGTYGLVITPRSAQAIQFRETRKHVVELANAIGSSVRVGAFDEASSIALGQALFPAEVKQQLAQVKSLRIHANGPLASLPFALLKSDGTAGDNGWLNDRFSISYLSDLAFRDSEPRSTLDGREELSLVAFAAPTSFQTSREAEEEASSAPLDIADYYSADTVNYTALASLPPLPGTEAEVRAIAEAGKWQSQHIFVGAKANEAAVSGEETRRADIVIFATHGIVAGEVEGIAQPALVLAPQEAGSDGVLTASEIAQLDLQADLIILSSCDSAAGMGGGLPAFSGLVQSFRQAGAKDLLVTHWKVRDDVAAFVSSQTILNYRKGMPKRQAFNEAIRALRDDSGLEGVNSPAVWAPFVLIEG